jgi:hypothetical protein
MFEILFFGLLPHLFLYTIEIGQIAFVVAIIVISVSVIVKIIKNRKTKKNLS